MIINQDKEQLASELRGSLLRFNQFFYKIITGRDYIVSQPVGRESHHITICRAYTELFRHAKPAEGLLVNIPPGYGKSVLTSMFVAWCYAHYGDCNFIYISYSHELAAEHTAFIKQVMSCAQYKYLFDTHISSDSRAKDSFTTTKGGKVRAFGSGGAVTGCFDYETKVLTESGWVSIGEIVENKVNTRVYSIDLDSGNYEFKPICKWFINPPNDIIRVDFNDGGFIECTPDHKILTKNRGWVEAIDLSVNDFIECIISSDALDYTPFYSNISRKNSKWRCSIKHQLNCIRTKLSYLFSMLRPKSFGGFLAYSSNPNINDSSSTNIKHFSYIFASDVSKSQFTNGQNVRLRKSLHANHSAMINGIFHVFCSGAVAKVFQSIIKSFSVKMSRIKSLWSFPNKSLKNKLVNESFLSFAVLSNGNLIIPCSTKPWGKLFSGISNYFSRFVSHGSRVTSNISDRRDAIPSVTIRDVSPLNIAVVRHVNKTYCLEVEKNHNFTISTSSGAIIVSNCDAGLPDAGRFSGCVLIDDAHKPNEVHSDTIRQAVIRNYQETILQRPRDELVPIVFIGQRLHEDDLAAYLLSGKDVRKWKPIVLKGIDEAGNALLPETQSVEYLRDLERKHPFVFYSQIQQNPIPSGGSLFKKDWFVILDYEPDILYSFITADTAETSKTHNDATVFSFFGIYEIQSMGVKTGIYGLHWIDCIEIWVEPKDLKQSFIDFWAECMRYKKPPQLAAIEKKSTGSTLLSLLEEIRTIKLMDIPRNANSGNKTARFIDCQPYVAERKVSLPKNGRHTGLCVEHMGKITANDAHRLDDVADTLADAIKIALIDKTIISSTINAVDHSDIASRLMSKQSKINRLRDRRG